MIQIETRDPRTAWSTYHSVRVGAIFFGFIGPGAVRDFENSSVLVRCGPKIWKLLSWDRSALVRGSLIETVSWEWHSLNNHYYKNIIWGTLLVVIDGLFYLFTHFRPVPNQFWTWHFNDVLWILKNSPFLMTKKLLFTCKNHFKYTSITPRECSGTFSGVLRTTTVIGDDSSRYFWGLLWVWRYPVIEDDYLVNYESQRVMKFTD